MFRTARKTHSTTSTLLTTFGMILCWSSFAAAATPTDPFFGKGGIGSGFAAAERFHNAYLSLQNDPIVSSVLKSAGHMLTFNQEVASNRGVTTQKFQDYFRGLEVIGAKAMVHQGDFQRQITHSLALFDLDLNPAITSEVASSIALSENSGLKVVEDPELKILPSEAQNSAQLVYWVKLEPQSAALMVSGADVLVDAHSGQIVMTLPRHLDIAPVDVHQASDACQMVGDDGYPVFLDHTKCLQTVKRGRVSRDADVSARHAASNAKRVLNYYLSHHSRDSYDNKGANTVSVVHVGAKMANAFWDSTDNIMAYGDGDGEFMGDLTLAVDVAGHEMTHGVVSQTANLFYQSESGALNEAYADFFGKLIANDQDWMVGRKVFVKQDPKSGIRNLADPAMLNACAKRDAEGKCIEKKPYPANYAERFVPYETQCSRAKNDNCFVHVNSTIWSHGAYLVLQAIGQEKAEQIYYLTLTHYLTERSNFAVAKMETMRACAQLYDAATCNQVESALAQVGL